MTLSSLSSRLSALVIVVASAAMATAQTPSANAFGLKLGVFFPTDSGVRNNIGKTGFTVGVGYYLKDTATEQGSIDLDYSRVGGTDYFQSISLGYTGRFYQGSNSEGNAPYLGFSAGISFNRVSASSTGSGGSGGGVSDNKTSPYGEAIVGYRFTKGAAVEAFYRLTSDLDGFHSNSFGVRVNYKF